MEAVMLSLGHQLDWLQNQLTDAPLGRPVRAFPGPTNSTYPVGVLFTDVVRRHLWVEGMGRTMAFLEYKKPCKPLFRVDRSPSSSSQAEQTPGQRPMGPCLARSGSSQKVPGFFPGMLQPPGISTGKRQDMLLQAQELGRPT